VTKQTRAAETNEQTIFTFKVADSLPIAYYSLNGERINDSF
jgi:hypothetical protein